MTDAPPSLTADAKRVAKFVAKWSAIAAFLCHCFPTHYRPICDAIEQVARTCTGVSP